MKIGDSLEIYYDVNESDSATNIAIDDNDSFPNVLATARMVALMEVASARLMKKLLSSDENSVGVEVNVSHLAATAIGAKVRIVSEFIGQQGKLFSFNISLYDSNGLAGQGKHSRAIVNTERLLSKAGH